MHLIQNPISDGCIVFYFGCMCAGKGVEMALNALRAQYRYSPERPPKMFKPKRETGLERIESRIGFSISAETLPDDVDLTCTRLRETFERPSVLGIDDAHFLYVPKDGDPVDPNKVTLLMDTLLAGARSGSEIYLAGLDADYRAQPFPFSAALLQSPFVKKEQRFAICTKCRQPTATLTQRLVDGRPAPHSMPTVVAKGSDAERARITYPPRCIHCYEIPT